MSFRCAKSSIAALLLMMQFSLFSILQMHVARLQEEGGSWDLSGNCAGVLLSTSTNSMIKAFKELKKNMEGRFLLLSDVLENVPFPESCSIVHFRNEVEKVENVSNSAARKSVKTKCSGLHAPVSRALEIRNGGNADMKDLASAFIFLFFFGLTKGTSTATARCLWRMHNGIMGELNMSDSLDTFLDPTEIIGEPHSTCDTSLDIVSPFSMGLLGETIWLVVEANNLMCAAVNEHIKSIEDEEEDKEEEEEEEEESATKTRISKRKTNMRKRSDTGVCFAVPLMVLNFADHVINNPKAKGVAHKCAKVFDCTMFGNDCYRVLYLILQVLSSEDLSKSHGVQSQRGRYMSFLEFLSNRKNSEQEKMEEFWSIIEEGKYEKMSLLTECFVSCADKIANRVSILAERNKMDRRGDGNDRTFAKRLEQKDKSRENKKGRGKGKGRGSAKGKDQKVGDDQKKDTEQQEGKDQKVGDDQKKDTEQQQEGKDQKKDGKEEEGEDQKKDGKEEEGEDQKKDGEEEEGEDQIKGSTPAVEVTDEDRDPTEGGSSSSSSSSSQSVFCMMSHDEAQAAFFSPEDEEIEETAAKPAGADKLQRTQLLPPKPVLERERKSVLEALSEEGGSAEPMWLGQEGMHFSNNVRRKVYGAMSHFQCPHCVSIYLSFNSGTHYKKKCQLAKRLVEELKGENSHLRMSILRDCQKDTTMQSEDFPELIKSLKSFVWVVLTAFPGLDSWIPALEFARQGKGLPCGNDVGESGHLSLSVTDPLNFGISYKFLSTVMAPEQLPWKVNAKLKAQSSARMAGTGDGALSILPLQVERCISPEARSCLLGGLSFLQENARGSPHDQVAFAIFDWFFTNSCIWRSASWASKKRARAPPSIVGCLENCVEYGERSVHLEAAMKTGELWRNDSLFFSYFLRLQQPKGVHCYSRSNESQLLLAQLMLEKRVCPLRQKFRQAFHLDQIKVKNFGGDYTAEVAQWDCANEIEAIRGSAPVKIILPVLQEEHALASGLRCTNEFTFELNSPNSRDSHPDPDANRLQKGWYKCDFVHAFAELLQQEVLRSSRHFQNNGRIRIGVNLHYLGAEQISTDATLSEGMVRRARATILGSLEVAGGMELNARYDMVICAYNMTRYHWLPYTVHLQEQSVHITLYDDGKETRNLTLLKKHWANVFDIDDEKKIIVNIVRRQEHNNGSDCGPRTLLDMMCLAFKRRPGNEKGFDPSEGVDWWDDGADEAQSGAIVKAFRRGLTTVWHHLLMNYKVNGSVDTLLEDKGDNISQEDSVALQDDGSDEISSVSAAVENNQMHGVTMGGADSTSQHSGSAGGLAPIKKDFSKKEFRGKRDYSTILTEESSESSSVSVESKAKQPFKRMKQSPPENANNPKKAARERAVPSGEKKTRGTKQPVKISTGKGGSPNAVHPMWKIEPLSLSKGRMASSSSLKKRKITSRGGGA